MSLTDRADRELGPEDELSLLELVNRVLDKGVVIRGDVVLSVAGVDLVYLGLRLLLTSAETMERRRLATTGESREVT